METILYTVEYTTTVQACEQKESKERQQDWKYKDANFN